MDVLSQKLRKRWKKEIEDPIVKDFEKRTKKRVEELKEAFIRKLPRSWVDESFDIFHLEFEEGSHKTYGIFQQYTFMYQRLKEIEFDEHGEAMLELEKTPLCGLLFPEDISLWKEDKRIFQGKHLDLKTFFDLDDHCRKEGDYTKMKILCEVIDLGYFRQRETMCYISHATKRPFFSPETYKVAGGTPKTKTNIVLLFMNILTESDRYGVVGLQWSN